MQRNRAVNNRGVSASASSPSKETNNYDVELNDATDSTAMDDANAKSRRYNTSVPTIQLVLSILALSAFVLYTVVYGSVAVNDPPIYAHNGPSVDTYNGPFMGAHYRVTTPPCSLTAVLFDSEVFQYTSKPTHFLWTTGLESFVQHVVGMNDDGHVFDDSNVCLTIQTSKCPLVSSLNEKKDEEGTGYHEEMLGNLIFERLGSNAQKFAKTGRIRVQFLDDEFYREGPCKKWKKPTNFISSDLYYEREFIDGVDSDHILIFEEQALWCRKFELDKWKDFAYVGAPWTAGLGYIRDEWSKIANIGAEYEKSWGDEDGGKGVFKELVVDEIPLVGSDRLTLINRTWIKRAINICPQKQLAQLPHDVVSKKECVATGRPEAEIYFGCVLNGIRAPIPSTFEASLFSAKFYWPDKLIKDEEENSLNEAIVLKHFGNEGVNALQRVRDGKSEVESNPMLVPVSVQTKHMKINTCPHV